MSESVRAVPPPKIVRKPTRRGRFRRRRSLDGEPTTTDVAVDGTAAWTDTGLDVAAGDDIEVTAGGEVFQRKDAAIGPEGFPNSPDLLTPLPVANHTGLLARGG